MNILTKNQLTLAYLTTRFSVDLPGERLWVSPLDENKKLKDFLKKEGIQTWSIITSDNPRSDIATTAADNESNRKRLLNILQTKKMTTWTSEGVGENSKWPSEFGFFIANISEAEAIQLALEFGQNAIVLGKEDGLAEIRWTLPALE